MRPANVGGEVRRNYISSNQLFQWLFLLQDFPARMLDEISVYTSVRFSLAFFADYECNRDITPTTAVTHRLIKFLPWLKSAEISLLLQHIFWASLLVATGDSCRTPPEAC